MDGSRVYCEECDAVFDSKAEFERHRAGHSGVGCESCPIDMAISKLVGLFTRRS